jgi:hypothetical protein
LDRKKKEAAKIIKDSPAGTPLKRLVLGFINKNSKARIHAVKRVEQE